MHFSSNITEKRLPKLAVSEVFQCSVDTRELITYSKQVQTDQEYLQKIQCKHTSQMILQFIPAPIMDRWNEENSRTYLGLQSLEWDDEIGGWFSPFFIS